METITNYLSYLKLLIEVTLYKIFADDGRRHMADYKIKEL